MITLRTASCLMLAMLLISISTVARSDKMPPFEIDCIIKSETPEGQDIAEKLCASVEEMLADQKIESGLILQVDIVSPTKITAQFAEDKDTPMGDPISMDVMDTNLSADMMESFAGTLVSYLMKLKPAE